MEHTSRTEFIVVLGLAFERSRGWRMVEWRLAAILIFYSSSRLSKFWLLAKTHTGGSKLPSQAPFSSMHLPDQFAKPGLARLLQCKSSSTEVERLTGRAMSGHKEDTIMSTGEQTKCAYERCECAVNDGERYCSDYCADASAEREIEIQCDCKHAPCALG